MKTTYNFFLILLTHIFLSVSCNKEDTSNSAGDCSEFRVSVSTWTNGNNARAETDNGIYPVSFKWSNGQTGVTIGGASGTLAKGTYTVTATDGRGCTAEASITITNAPTEIVIESAVTCVRHNAAFMTMGVYNQEGNFPNTPILDQGICYGFSAEPNVFDQITKTITFGEYELSVLTMATTYYARAYAITTEDTVYGEEHSFTTKGNPPPFSIGQTYQGGIISYISCDGQHGTIVLTQDLNTNGFPLDHTTAKSRCENLSQSGYDDWRLPSTTDFYFMHKNLHLQGLGNFHTGGTIYDGYWSSYSRYDTDKCLDFIARYFNFQQDSVGELCTPYRLRVRAVRDF
ncbi:MAG: hypothetical protein CMI36_00335 [Owenweeksia sp.]|nr:hypothetical protein [Owenweeksia sp.]MBF97412.1 hypothetical protein [Owenweeksia sp.]HBF20749.1 hypothetical protein [Cryomorphaceae bacterium]HCQ17023.1 hypothetical protein [Cryomorphaceae bacterium]